MGIDYGQRQLQSDFGQLAVPVSNFDMMQSLGGHALHLCGDGLIPISGETIHTTSYEKASSRLLRGAEQFVDVAPPISDMHTALGFAEQSGGLLQVFQPAKAFLFLNRDAGWIDLTLQCIRTFELASGPEFNRGQTKWKPSEDRQVSQESTAKVTET